MTGDHVYVDTQGQNHFCAHCGVAERIKAPAPITEMVEALKAFADAHRECPAPEKLHAPPRPNRPLPLHESAFDPWPGLAEWLRDGEIGLSSLTLATALTGLPLTNCKSTPRDADDFRRCVGLLNAVPTLRPRMQMARQALGPKWLPLLRHWPELETLSVASDDAKGWRALTELIQGLLPDD